MGNERVEDLSGSFELDSGWSRATMMLNHVRPISFDVWVPDDDAKSIAIGSARVERVGGPSAADEAYRRDLYYWVGRLAVAGGKAEAAMKRLLVLDRKLAERSFEEVDETWATLVKLLRSTEQNIPGLKQVLDWSDTNRVKIRRDDAIHCDWWDWADTELTKGRTFRKGPSALVVDKFDTLTDAALAVEEFASRLDELVGLRWLTMRIISPDADAR
ncbi:hypothetical protein [Subtercola sp. YIM 133946]|uniref:hypothetical protein n=1 Tax=Subtercola sp. YIM 133946 TaxID=3118909 RepID=UPI002F951D3E